MARFASIGATMFVKLLTWADSVPRYWTVAWTCFGIVVVLALIAAWARREKAWWQHPALISAAMLVVLLAFRWPEIFDNRQYPDPDESQFIAGASVLRHNPIFWRSVDGTTHGPLTEAPLVLASLLRGTIDFTRARFVSSLLVWLALVSAWFIFRHLFGAALASLLTLPLLAVHAFTQAWSFVAYCSEHVPNTLIALACCALFTSLSVDGTNRSRLPRLFAAGLLLGAVPFAKLQAVPIALVALGGGAWLIFASDDRQQRVRSLGALFGGAITVAIITILLVLIFGVWRDFFAGYVLENLRYATANRFPADRSITWTSAPGMLLELGSAVAGFNEFALWTAGFTVVGLFFVGRFSQSNRRVVTVAFALVLASAFAAIAPGRPYLHYLQLIIFPLGLLGGAVAGSLFSIIGEDHPAAASAVLNRAAITTAFLVCGLMPQLWWRIREPQPFVGFFTERQGMLVQSAVSREILRHARPGEHLGMWGWMPVFWVETGMLQATRDGQSSRQIEPHPRCDYYRARFLKDLIRAQPPVFVDAVGRGNFVYEDRTEFAHETFTELRDYLEQNYHLVDDVDGTRIYVRNDRS